MKVYMVCQNIDLGYHVHAVYLSEGLAAIKCKVLNQAYAAKKIQGLVNGCGYTQEDAEKFIKDNRPEYFIESQEVADDDSETFEDEQSRLLGELQESEGRNR